MAFLPIAKAYGCRSSSSPSQSERVAYFENSLNWNLHRYPYLQCFSAILCYEHKLFTAVGILPSAAVSERYIICYFCSEVIAKKLSKMPPPTALCWIFVSRRFASPNQLVGSLFAIRIRLANAKPIVMVCCTTEVFLGRRCYSIYARARRPIPLFVGFRLVRIWTR